MVTYTLTNIAKEFMIETGDSNQNKYARYLQILVAGLRELEMDISGTPKTVQISVTDTNEAPLPADYINYVKIATIDSAGNLANLGLNSNMTFKRAYDDCGDPKISIPTVPQTQNQALAFAFANGNMLGWDGFTDNFRNGEIMGRFFGMGGGNNANGYYRIDKDRGYIQLQDIHCSIIVLEYLADLSLVNGDFEVHPFLLETLKAWLYWKSIQRNLRIGLGEKEMAKNDYLKAKRLSLSRFSSHTISEWKEALRVNNKAAAKF